MSTDNVKAFYEKVAADEALGDKVKAVGEGLAGRGQTAPDDTALAEIVKIAGEAGFDFSADDWKAAQGKAGELSTQDLDKVAGGSNRWCTSGNYCGVKVF